MVGARGLRGLADGLVSVVLTIHLLALGFSPSDIGVIVAATLVGSALLTIGVGFVADRWEPRRVLLGGTALMIATGVAFACCTSFWPLLVVAVVGTLNPSAGDVTLFLPTEQAVIASATPARDRPTTFAWYNLAGGFAGAIGALAAGLPARAVALWSGGPRDAGVLAFAFYAGVAAVLWGLYRTAPIPALPRRGSHEVPLARSRAVVMRLTVLFSVDSFGGGFVVQSLLVLWLAKRFGFSADVIGVVLFASGLLGALSQLASARLAARIGLVRTMVYTHLPANVLLVVAGIVPHAGVAVGCLLVRALLSQMDVPVRQTYVMSVVPPEERAAAATMTAVPRSLAAALPPLVVGLMLERSTFGWPLVCGGVLKAVYDVLLLVQLRRIPLHDAA
jgi:MFS family permease